MPFVDAKLKQKHPAPPPVINIDLSKEKICKKTLELVDKEVKAIAVTIDLDFKEKVEENDSIIEGPIAKDHIKQSPTTIKEGMSGFDKPKMKPSFGMPFTKVLSINKYTESHKESSQQNRTENRIENTTHSRQNEKAIDNLNKPNKEPQNDKGPSKPNNNDKSNKSSIETLEHKNTEKKFLNREDTGNCNKPIIKSSKVKTSSEKKFQQVKTSSEKKIQQEPFFDFLKDSTPIKKSSKYISKREELIRNHHKHYKVGKKEKVEISVKPEKVESKCIDKKQSKQKDDEITKEVDEMKKKIEKKISKTSNEHLSKHSIDNVINVFKQSDKKKTESDRQFSEKNCRATSPVKIKDQNEKSLMCFENKSEQDEDKKNLHAQGNYEIIKCQKKSKKEENICNLCGEVFNLIGSYKKHSKTKHIFKCDFCELIFNRATKLDDHMNTAHDFVGHIEPTQCGLCGDVFRRSSLLARHISSPHTFSCGECDMRFQSEKSLNKHHCNKQEKEKDLKETMESKFDTGEKEIKEPISNDTRPSEPLLTNKRLKKEVLGSMALIQNADEMIIIDWPKNIKHENDLIKYGSDKNISKIRSPIEVKEINELDSKTIHIDEKMHQNKTAEDEQSKEEYKCDICVVIFEGEKELFIHNTRIHHESWSYVDTKKNANWEKKENMNTEPKGPFVCELCNEVHKLWNPLLKHLWMPHLFICEYCDLSFNRNTKLEDHVNTVHDLVGLIDSTKCGMCGETFGRSSTLARHINSPHNFPCIHCGKSFQTKAVLNKHRQNCSKFQIFNVIEKCLDKILY